MTSDGLHDVELGELLGCVIDHRGRTPKKLGGSFAEDGVPVISAKNVRNSRIELGAGARYVTPEMWDRWMPVKLVPGDVILTSEAPLGEVAYLGDGAEYCLGQRLFALRPDRTRLDPRYLFYALQGPILRQRLLSRASGTTAQGIRQSELVRVKVTAPPLVEQRRTAWVLGSLDDKIESNRRIAATLEEIAATRFKARFVDFVGHDDLVESEIGPIPRGWRVGALAELASDRRDSVRPELSPETHFEHFSFSAFDDGRVPALVTGEELKSAKLGVSSNSVLISKLNPQWQRVWWPRPSGNGTPVCSPEFVVMEPNEGVPHSLLYAIARSDPRLRAHILSHATGTTGSRQRVRPAEMLAARLPMPPSDQLGRESSVLDALFAREEAARDEARILAESRDALLPRLVSGQIRVPPGALAEAQSDP